MTDSNSLKNSIETLMSSLKNWKEFQTKNFTGNHDNASQRILDFIENEIEKNN